MLRRLITVVGVGALTFAVYVVSGGTVQEQVDALADAGLVTPNRDATCPVRLDPDFAADAGVGVYQRLTFPVILTVLADAGRDVQMPPLPLQRVRQALDVVGWNDCSLAASTAPVRALWGSSRPFTAAGVAKPWCRAKLDAGLLCLLVDGGSFDTPGQIGAGNVSLCSTRAAPATCERVSGGGTYQGDDPEDL